MDDARQPLSRPQPVALYRREEQRAGAVHAGSDADRARGGLRRRGRRRHAAAVAGAQAAHGRRKSHDASTRRWSGRCRRCWRAWSERGISIDRPGASPSCPTISARSRRALEEEINEIAGDAGQSVGSPKQLGDILFGKMGLPGGTKTKTGQWSTGARELEELAEHGHELPRKILDWRQVSKLRSTYTEALPNYVNPTTQRVHTSYALAATSTGRLSSSEPNLQNIPIRTEDGRKIRKRLRRRARHEAGVGRLFADRTAAAVGSRRGADAAQGVPGRRRHPRHDRVGNVRRAGQGHAGRHPPPRQGDQFRHHLRHLGLRARQPARASSARKPAPTSRNISSASPASATTWTRRASSAATTATCSRCSGASATTRTSRTPTPRSARSTSARRSTRGCRARAADIIRRAMIRIEPELDEGQAQRADAAAGARRTDLRGAGGRSRRHACRSSRA